MNFFVTESRLIFQNLPCVHFWYICTCGVRDKKNPIYFFFKHITYAHKHGINQKYEWIIISFLHKMFRNTKKFWYLSKVQSVSLSLIVSHIIFCSAIAKI